MCLAKKAAYELQQNFYCLTSDFRGLNDQQTLGFSH